MNGANSAYNFTWETELDNLGRPKKTKTTHNNITKQHSQNYYDALGNLMMVGVGSNGSGGFVDYHAMKMNIRNQVVSMMSNFVRIGLSYNANGNITSQTWSNQQLENQSGTNPLNVNRYDYYYDNMNRLTGADYKQVTMGSNPFAYFSGLTSNVPSDFNCFVDESEVAIALQPTFEEIERNDLRLDESEVIDITNALSNLQAYYVSGNSAYGNMTTYEKNKFVDQYVEDAQLNRYTPEKLEMYFALWAEDSIYIDSLKNKDLMELSKKYTHWLLGTLPFDPPMQCASNPSSTVYGYLPDFVQPTFTSNANKYDMAYWYTKNGNITQLNRTDNAGIKTVQQYAYANSANNKLTGVTWTVGTNTPFTHNYGYDATGNLLNDSRNNVSSITYSAYSDMPKQIVSSGLEINYRYFGGARSVKILSSTDREYYIAGMVLKQTGEVKSYQTANGYAVPNSNGTSVDYFYNVKDWLGTNRAVISATGQMVNALDVDPYGKKLPGRQQFNSNYEGYRYQFTGHEQDGETGYQYHGARYYAEELGRYMGVDPLAMKFANWSTYNYTMSNPIMMTDPTGMSAQGWGGTYKDPSKGEAGGVTWTYDPNINSENYQSMNYDVYMDEGQRHNFNLGNGYVGDVYLTADGKALKGHKSFAEEVIIRGYSGEYYEDPYAVKSTPPSADQEFKDDSNTPMTSDNYKFDVIFQEQWNTQSIEKMVADRNYRRMAATADFLGKIFTYTAITLVAAPLAWEYGAYTTSQLAGEYGATAKVATWYRLGNTAADIVSQTIDISTTGGSWNWGSTLGNLTLNNPLASAAPGTLYDMARDNNLDKNLYSHLGNYALSATGNYLTGKIGGAPKIMMSGGMKHGLGTFTMPLIFNTATNVFK